MPASNQPVLELCRPVIIADNTVLAANNFDTVMSTVVSKSLDLPALADTPVGYTVTVISQYADVGNTTVRRTGTDQLKSAVGATVTEITVASGATLTLVNGNDFWYTVFAN